VKDSDVRKLILKTQEIRVLANQADASLYCVFDYDKNSPERAEKVDRTLRFLKRIETLAAKG